MVRGLWLVIRSKNADFITRDLVFDAIIPAQAGIYATEAKILNSHLPLILSFCLEPQQHEFIMFYSFF